MGLTILSSRHFYDKRMGQEVDGEVLGDEYKGYLFKITGGNDKQGFTMKQGVLVNGRVRILMKKSKLYKNFRAEFILAAIFINTKFLNDLKLGTTCYRPRREGERKRKSVRGCICGPDLAVIALKITKKGEAEIEGVTDSDKPRRLGPKRANYIRKVFALRKKDDVRKYVVRREIKKGDKTFYKSPKIQRLITEKRLRRKRSHKKEKQERYQKEKDARAKYDKVLSQYIKEKRVLHNKAAGGETATEAAPLAKPVATGTKAAAGTAAAKTTTATKTNVAATKTATTAVKTDVAAKTNVAAKATTATKTANVTASAKVTTQASKQKK